MDTRKRRRLKRRAKDVAVYLDELIRDEHLRANIASAAGHGFVAAERIRKGSGLAGAGDRIASDAELRKNVKALLHDLDEAGARVQRKPTHRLRNAVLVLGAGGSVLAITAYARRVLAKPSTRSSDLQSPVARVDETIEVDVPVSTAYQQWTRFEDFPHFMEGVEEVTQLDDTLLRWAARIAGKREEWDARITEQTPDRRIAWKSVSGKETNGEVSFEPSGSARTRIHVSMSYRPDALDRLGSAIGLDDRRVRGDLQRFKELIETRTGTRAG